MSNAAWDFDSSLNQQHVQVFGLAGNRSGKVQEIYEVYRDRNNYTTNGGENIVRALEFLVSNPTLDLGAVSIATVLSVPNGQPRACTLGRGQDAVDRLRGRGVAVVAGLKNNDILAENKTWPNCLKGVINAARTDGFGGVFKGTGIGANTIDFYATSATEVKPRFGQGDIIVYGNSNSAPKVAAAFTMLHRANPLATLDQKYRALDQASTSMYSYKGYPRRRIKSSQINNAIARLNEIVIEDNQPPPPPAPPPSTGDPDDIFFNPVARGPRYGGESSDTVEIPINFATLIQSKVSSQSQIPTINSNRDVVFKFTADVFHDFASQRTFTIHLNDEELFRTEEFPRAGGDITKSYTFNRNLFSNGDNKIEIRPALGTSDWGVKDVIVSLLPSIPLTLNVTDTNFYGYSETPTRFTGARFKFDLANLDDELQFDVTGWDIDRPDETQVFLNGVSIGYLTQGLSNQLSEPNRFNLDKSLLRVGSNTIELQQRVPDSAWRLFQDEKWSVTNIAIKEVSKVFIVPIVMFLLDD